MEIEHRYNFVQVALNFATMEQLRLKLGDAGTHYAGLVMVVMLWFSMNSLPGMGVVAVQGLDTQPSLEGVWSSHSNLEGLPTHDPQGLQTHTL